MVGILHDDWSNRLGENTYDQILKTFGGYALPIQQYSPLHDLSFSKQLRAFIRSEADYFQTKVWILRRIMVA